MHVISPVLIIIYSLIGLISAYFAKKNGRNPYFWFSMGVFFGVLTLIVMFFINIRSKKAPLQPVQAPAPIVDSKLWYYLTNDKQMGPVSLNKLFLLLKEGQITFTTYVWNEELESWKFLNETKEYSLLKEKSTS